MFSTALQVIKFLDVTRPITGLSPALGTPGLRSLESVYSNLRAAGRFGVRERIECVGSGEGTHVQGACCPHGCKPLGMSVAEVLPL